MSINDPDYQENDKPNVAINTLTNKLEGLRTELTNAEQKQAFYAMKIDRLDLEISDLEYAIDLIRDNT